MYSGMHAKTRAAQPAIIMAQSGETITLRRARSAQQSSCAFPSQPRPQAPRPLRDPDGEQRALRRMLRRRRARGSLLHLHQFVSHADEVAYIVNNSESKVLIISQEKRDDRPEGARAVPEGRGRARRGRTRRRQAHPQSRRGDRRPAGDADRRREPRHGDALFIRHDRPAERHPAPLAGAAAGASSCRCSISFRSSGAIAKG